MFAKLPLTQCAAIQLVSSLILRCLDCCGSVLAGLPSLERLCFKNKTLQDLLSGNQKKMSLLSCLNFTGYLSNSEWNTSWPFMLSIISTALFHQNFHLCSTFINPLILLGMLMRNSLLSLESAQKPSLKGPFSVKHSVKSPSRIKHL